MKKLHIRDKIFFDFFDWKSKIATIFVASIALYVFFVCSRPFGGGKAEYIIWLVVFLTMIFLLCICLFIKMEFDKYVFLFLLLLGGLAIFIQPILNVPDETAHLARAELVSRGILFIDPNEKVYETIQGIRDLSQNFGKTYTQSNFVNIPIDYTESIITHVAASNIFIMYIPQSIGVLAAKLFGLDVIWMLWLGRLSNLLFYCLIISNAIKIAPRLKMILFFIAALPISIQQAASCSPDAMINAVAIMLVALSINMYCTKDGLITEKKSLLFLALGLLETIMKVTNICMVGLILLIPVSKFKDRRRAYIVKAGIICCTIIIGAVYYYYTSRFPVSLEQMDYLEGAGVNSAEQIKYIIFDFRDWIQVFGSALVYQTSGFINSMTSFGWLNCSFEILTPITIFMFAKICFQEQGINLRAYQKNLVFLMILGVYGLTCLALYISWTGVGETNIAGIQGRYFIPLLGLCGVLFCGERGVSGDNERIARTNISVILCMACFMLNAIAVFYY